MAEMAGVHGLHMGSLGLILEEVDPAPPKGKINK